MLLCVLSFMGFLRFSEVIYLKNSDNFERNSFLFLLKKAKLMYTEKAPGCIYLSYSRLSVQ